MKYSCHAWSWTPVWNSDSLHLIDHVKALGFDGIEIPLIVIERVDAAATRARAQAAGVDILCAVACLSQTDPTSDDPETRERALEYLRDRIRLAAEIGSHLVSGITYAGAGRRAPASDEQWERAVEALRQTARFAQEVGVTIGIEAVSRFDSSLINTARQALALRADIGEPNVGVHLDSFHMNIEERSLGDAIRAALPHLCHFHLCENHRREVGTGLVDFDAIYRALAEGGHDGWSGLEIFAPVLEPVEGERRGIPLPMDEVVSRSLAFLKGVEARQPARRRSIIPPCGR